MKTPEDKVWVLFLLLKTWTFFFKWANLSQDPLSLWIACQFCSVWVIHHKETGRFFLLFYLLVVCLWWSPKMPWQGLSDLRCDLDKSRGLWVVWDAYNNELYICAKIIRLFYLEYGTSVDPAHGQIYLAKRLGIQNANLFCILKHWKINIFLEFSEVSSRFCPERQNQTGGQPSVLGFCCWLFLFLLVMLLSTVGTICCEEWLVSCSS